MEDTLSRLKSLQLGDKSALSIELQEPEYVLNIDSQSSSTVGNDVLLAATSSTSAIRLYRRNTLSYVSTIKAPEKLITGVKFSREMPNVVYCSFTTGVLRAWDVRTSSHSCVQELRPGLMDKLTLTSVDLSCDGRLISAGTELVDDNVFLIFWDSRSSEVLGCYSDSHSDDITQLKFHPDQKDSLLSAAADGLVCLYDVSQTSEEDALQSVFNADASVAHTGWVGPDLDIVYCVTHMNTCMLWNSISGDEVLNCSDKLSANQDFDYLIDCFQPSRTSSPHLSAGKYSGAVGIYSLGDDSLDNVTTLTQGHSSVVRCISWDSQSCSLVTGGEDDLLCLWVSDGQYSSTQHTKSSTNKIKSTKKLKKYRKSALV